MLSRRHILELVPQQGTMCLLDGVEAWSAAGITCGATSHLLPDNPLRRDGRLGAIAGVEYGLQAAALHSALAEGSGGCGRAASEDAPMPHGLLAALRDVTLHVDRLDDRRLGTLRITAHAELRAASGVIYRFVVASGNGASLVEGRGTIAFAAAAG